MNSFKHQYIKLKLQEEFFNKIKNEINHSQHFDVNGEKIDKSQLQPGLVISGIDSRRKCKLSYLSNQKLDGLVNGLVTLANEKCGWNLDINYIEPIQYTVYESGDFYDWHIDEDEWTPNKRSNGRIRKVSFTIVLDSDFEGGDFLLEVNGNPRTFNLTERSCIIFFSDALHKVSPVTSGVRKSLVGWAQGPAFK